MTYIGPREKLMERPASSLNDRELVQLIIGSGTERVSVKTIARRVVRTLKQGEDLSVVHTFLSIEGLGVAGSSRLVAGFELARRYQGSTASPADVKSWLRDQAKEAIGTKIVYAIMTRDGRMIARHTLLVKDGSYLAVQDVLRTVLLENGSIVHVARQAGEGERFDDLVFCRRLYAACVSVGVALMSYQLTNDSEIKEFV